MKQLLPILVLLILCVGCELAPSKPIVAQVIITKTEVEEKKSSEDLRFEELPLVEVTYCDARTGNVVFRTQVLSNYSVSTQYLYADLEEIGVNLRDDPQSYTSLKVSRSQGSYGEFRSEVFYLKDESGSESRVFADHCKAITIEVSLQEDYQTWKDWLLRLKEKCDEYRRKIEEEYNSHKKRILPPK